MSQVSAHVDGKKQPVDRRVHVRQPVRSLAYVELGEGNGGIVLNVSEGGIAVQAVMSLMGDELPCVRVQLAHCKKRIEAKGRITWTGGYERRRVSSSLIFRKRLGVSCGNGSPWKLLTGTSWRR